MSKQTEVVNRTEFLRDVLITAVEQGSGYWADIREYVVPECRAIISEHEEPSSSIVINAEAIEQGIAKILAGKIQINQDIWKSIAYASAHNDSSMIDSECADCIVQAAVFGNIVYG